ncbi:hypothetical protein [Mitsuaria sp. GD03876]|uniref:hypothetical protein n=1 Tax=Mitsuaria sp. GD03876 TaxID=2975399 RepID=UPI0024487AA6|nr:hypothetical protein [Mitsuaria sp. GD03876]MDH0864656.1 hypothetical protein [Mitsuaria sp. GD03876]
MSTVKRSNTNCQHSVAIGRLIVAVEYTLELEGYSPDWALIEMVLRRSGVVGVTYIENKPARGYFENSSTALRIIEHTDYHPVTAEGYSGERFLVRYVIVFRLNVDVDESASEIHLFLSLLSEITPCKFVLSF